MNKAKKLAFFFLLMMATVFGTEAFASTATSAFDDVYDLLVGWSTGALGKSISLGMFIVGIGVGLVNQSVIAAVAGALVLQYAPTVISGIMSAVI
ncbi:MAG: pili assembly chaperone [Methylovulum sp.]|nr:MAG: pili assembly chaperone [Methylovulum sp.]